MSKVDIQYESGVLRVIGTLDCNTVKGAFEKANVYFNGCESLTVDLEKVERTDSSGLALLLAWLRRSKAQGVKLNFINLPGKMKELGRVSSLDQILPLSK